jgi:cellulose synthase/poly-beta-1,6-N-acetylglucosamine synthase-like glycosyltransferase
MVNFIEGVFFFYIFLGLYMTGLLLFLYYPNRKRLFEYPKGKLENVSVIVPCYNASKDIGKTIDALQEMDWPKDMIEIIVVDDKSTDNSVEVVRRYEKKYNNVRLIVNKRNSGGAAEPTNIGIKAAKYEYIAVTDDDSSPQKDALRKMIGFLQEDKKVGGVTCAVLARNSKTFMQKLQDIEYNIIAWNRKLLDMVGAVYVTPGPFALYRKKVLVEIGMFEVNNLTQDIEIVWKMMDHGYSAKMCLAAKVYSETPTKFRVWWKQRVRWNIGGAQCIIKYKHLLFRKGMLGAFIIPFFSANLFIGLFGLGLFVYLMIRRLVVSFLSTKYSVYASATILRFQELTFAPSVLNFFGVALFFLGLLFTLIGLGVMGGLRRKNKNVFNILFYLLVYLTIYPLIMITSLYKLARGNYSW